MLYPLNDIYPAIQGEGCQAGLAMALVRLHGCPVGCPFCDTKETWDFVAADERATIPEVLGQNPLWARADPDAIAAEARRQGPALRWALVTGGEPANSPLGPLVDSLRARGLSPALETSGTALGHVGAGFAWVCVSPKPGMPGGLPLLDAAFEDADEIKQVVGRPADLEALDRLLDRLGPTKAQVCLQPVSLNPKATELCARTVEERGWRLSLQIHKFLGAR